ARLAAGVPQRAEALRAPGRLGAGGGLVALGLGAHARGLAARLRDVLAGVGLGLVLQPLLVLLRAVDVVERGLDLLRRPRVGQVELGHDQAGLVFAQRRLQALARRDGERAAGAED